MSQRVQEFNAAVRRLIVPTLVDLGFKGNHRRRVFRRAVEDRDCSFVQIIELQIGSKSMSGRFTVNLGVFCAGLDSSRSAAVPYVTECMFDMTKRLGFLHIPPRGVLARAVGLKQPEPFDFWWKLDDDRAAMERTMSEACHCLLQRGIPWLNETATKERLDLAKRLLDERKDALRLPEQDCD